MGARLTSAQWSQALDPTILKFFELGFGRRSPLLPALYNVQSSDSNDEEVGSIGAVTPDAWDNYEMTGRISQADFDQGYKRTYTHREYPLTLEIQRKLADDNKHAQIFKLAERMGDSAFVKREADAASTFNNGFDDNFPGADAVGLLSTAHPLSPNKTGSTQTNEGTLVLTKTNVETTRVAMMAFTDDNNNKVNVTPNMLLVPPDLQNEAEIIVGSVLDPDSGNNAINPQSNRFSVMTWHALTDTTAWFMIDTNLMRMSLDWFNRVPLSIRPLDGEDTTVAATWIAYMRYSFGWSDWRWIYGQNG